MKKISLLFEQQFAARPESVERLPLEGSNRAYYRVCAPSEMYIGVENDDVRENKAFVYLSRHFESKGLPVPHIVAVNDDHTAYLQTCIKGCSLFEYLADERTNNCFLPESIALIKKILSELVRFQFQGAEGLDYSHCYPLPEQNKKSVMWDLNYFKYSFLKLTGISFDEDLLENDIECLANDILMLEGGVFMYRDFQSRNVIINDSQPYFIDFQGGRKGLLLYDLVSFVYQARARYPESLKREMIEHYRAELSAYRDIPVEVFYKQLQVVQLFRALQVLGAYGYRGWIEQKASFVESIPGALSDLQKLLLNTEECPSYLRGLLLEVIAKFCRSSQPSSINAVLEVTIMSFSYKQGLPRDDSGNGGGFLFDCRALHNPGRYDEYKKLTGRDESVIHFLEREEEVIHFFDRSYELVEASVKKYTERGFSKLFVGYGCTGGQHRSVYMAERLYVKLASSFPYVNFRLVHRQQDLSYYKKGEDK